MKRFYICAYGHVIRLSNKVDSPQQAAKECFGVVDRVTVLDAGTRKDELKKNSVYQSLIEKLKILHKQKTNNDIT